MILEKLYHHRFYPLLLCAAYLMLLGIIVYVIDYYSRETITHILKKWIPWNLKVNFLVIVIAILFCSRDLLDQAKQFLNKKGLFLVVIFIIAFSMTSFMTARTHRIFYDEDIYANVGQNIAITGQTGYCNYGTFEYEEYYPHWISYNKEPSGWPFLISLAFQLLGTDEFYAFLLNNLLFGAGVLVAFFITFHLTGSYFASFMAALAFMLIPHNLIWSNTAAAEPSAAFFSGLTVLSLILFLKKGYNRQLFFMASLIPFSCQMRSESMLLLPWGGIAFLVFSPKGLGSRRLWTFGLLTTLFLLPHLLHLYAVSGYTWGAEGDKFSWEFFCNNLYTNGVYYLDNRYFPVVLTALAAAGLLCSRTLLRWRLLMSCWFVMFWGVFLFFYAGSYRYGADVRFALVSFMPLAILAGMGGGWITNIVADESKRLAVSTLVVLVVLFSFLQFMPLVRCVGQEAWGSRHDHLYAREFIKKIPRRSIVLTQNPTMFLLWGQNAIQTYAGINNPGLIKNLMKKYQGHVYFHYNYWCNAKSEHNRRLCQAIKERYRLTEVASACEQDFEYGLYKMSIESE
jgi:hypothetical protein